MIKDCKYAIEEDKFHEAAFDAFITGYCYAHMLVYLEFKNKLIDNYVNKY